MHPKGARDYTPLSVPSIRFNAWLVNHTRPKRHRRHGPVVLKMDIEGAEYSIMQGLVGSGLMCSHVDAFVVEWHREKINSTSLPLGIDATLEWILTAPACGVRTFHLVQVM